MPLGSVPGARGRRGVAGDTLRCPPGAVPSWGADAPFGTPPGAEGFSLWRPASGNGDPTAGVRAAGSLRVEGWVFPPAAPSPRTKGTRRGLEQEQRHWTGVGLQRRARGSVRSGAAAPRTPRRPPRR